MQILRYFLDFSPYFLIKLAIQYQGFKYSRYRFKSPYNNFYDQIKNMQSWSKNDIQSYQKQKIRNLLKLAYKKTEFYNNRFKSFGISPDDFNSFNDLKNFPFLTKDDVRKNYSELLVQNYKGKIIQSHTSGSTGEPLQFVMPFQVYWQLWYAHMYYYYSWFGFNAKDRRATLGGRYLGRRNSGVIAHNFFENQLLLGVHSLNQKTIGSYVYALRKFHPKIIQGHPTAISRLVFLADKIGLNLPSVQTVFVTGETVFEHDRTLIENAFSCPVISHYGLGERVAMACECRYKTGLHVDDLIGYIELIPNDTGLYEIVATSLHNDAMPFIRYRTGDLVNGWIDGICECGRSSARLGKVQGRLDDIIYSTEGEEILPVQIRTNFALRFPNIPPYSVIQHKNHKHYSIYFFSNENLDRTLLEESKQLLCSWVGKDAHVNVTVSNPAERLNIGGKHRILINECPNKRSK